MELRSSDAVRRQPAFSVNIARFFQYNRLELMIRY